MQKFFDYIEHLKGKPHHVRKQITFAAATGGAALIGLVWFGVSLSSGAYAINGSNFAQATGAEATVTASAGNTSQLAGAAAAVDTNKTQAAHIEIIDAATTSTAANTRPEQTVIPF